MRRPSRRVQERQLAIARPKSRLASLPAFGWREYASLPELNLHKIKAKVDTGARTSSLHVDSLEVEKGTDGADWLRITLRHRDKGGRGREVCCVRSAGIRRVKSSTGHIEVRHALRTPLTVGEFSWMVEFTLTDRADMLFPILIGRAALRKRFLVDAGASFLQSGAAAERLRMRRKRDDKP
jgi:hypothetical protein